MEGKLSDVAVASIRIDGQTQQRPIDRAVVEHYADLRRDGVGLPAVSVVSDGTHYWLWDGFHRLEAEKVLGNEKVRASVTKGTQQDAVWLSYSANKTHGIPRPPGTVKRIIEQILCNPVYAEMPLTKIADHVGASRRYVIDVKNALLAQSEGGREPEEGQESDQTVANGVSDSANAKKGVNTHTLSRAGKVKVKSRRGKTYEQKSQEKREPEDEPEAPADADGMAIPADLEHIFSTRDQFDTFARRLSMVRGEIEDAVENNPEAFAALERQKIVADLAGMRQQFLEARPYLICPSCGGEDQENCKLCNGRGWLSRFRSRTVAIELRNPQRKVHGLALLTGASQKAGEETK